MTKTRNPTQLRWPDDHQGQQLRQFMKAQGISHEEIAQRMNRTPRTFGSYLSTYHINSRARRAIAEAMQTTQQAIFGPFESRELTQLVEGQQLRQYMHLRGVRVIDLAQRLGRNKATISGYFHAVEFTVKIRDSLLKALGATYEQVFASVIPPVSVELVFPEENEATTPADLQENLREIASRQLDEWRAVRSRLEQAGASTKQISLCQYQIWHLELLLPALSLP